MAFIHVIIPVYSAKKYLQDAVRSVLDQPCKDIEIILVNDACPQNSWEDIQHLCESDKRVVGIEMARNFGQMKAITAGLDYSTGKWVVGSHRGRFQRQ